MVNKTWEALSDKIFLIGSPTIWWGVWHQYVEAQTLSLFGRNARLQHGLVRKTTSLHCLSVVKNLSCLKRQASIVEGLCNSRSRARIEEDDQYLDMSLEI